VPPNFTLTARASYARFSAADFGKSHFSSDISGARSLDERLLLASQELDQPVSRPYGDRARFGRHGTVALLHANKVLKGS
jgi:hypothetical protein